MRVLVTGSRDVEGEGPARALINALLSVTHGHEGPHTLVHGDCPYGGVDLMAAAIARELGWEVEPHPADFKGRGRKAGPERNQRMVDLGADVCVAMPRPTSRGTIDCIGRARRADIPVVNAWEYASP